MAEEQIDLLKEEYRNDFMKMQEGSDPKVESLTVISVKSDPIYTFLLALETHGKKIDCLKEKEGCLLVSDTYGNLEGSVHSVTKNVVIIRSKERFPIDTKDVRLYDNLNFINFERYMKALKEIPKILNNEKHGANRLITSLLLDNSNMTGRFLDKMGNINMDTIIEVLKKSPEKYSKLNYEQKEAVFEALRSPLAYMIFGPPGTGKTKTNQTILYYLSLMGLRILVCGPSNVAVDTLGNGLEDLNCHMLRLGRGQVTGFAENISLMHYIRENPEIQELNMKIDEAIPKSHNNDAAKAELEACREKMEKIIKRITEVQLKKAQIIFCTIDGTGSNELIDFAEKLPSQTFDIVLIDECAQSLEVASWMAMIKGKKLIIAGDHNQLPPTIKTHSVKSALERTLYDRLRRILPKPCKTMLREQFRMNSALMNLVNGPIYDGMLRAHPSVKNISIAKFRGSSLKKNMAINDNPIQVFNTQKFGWSESKADTSTKNDEEAIYTIESIKKLKEAFPNLPNSEIGIISLYAAHSRILGELLGRNIIFEGIECSTVDGYQGREKAVIILCLVRSNKQRSVGFADNKKRMNVAVTRAKCKLIVIGDLETYKNAEEINCFINQFKKHQ